MSNTNESINSWETLIIVGGLGFILYILFILPIYNKALQLFSSFNFIRFLIIALVILILFFAFIFYIKNKECTTKLTLKEKFYSSFIFILFSFLVFLTIKFAVDTLHLIKSKNIVLNWFYYIEFLGLLILLVYCSSRISIWYYKRKLAKIQHGLRISEDRQWIENMLNENLDTKNTYGLQKHIDLMNNNDILEESLKLYRKKWFRKLEKAKSLLEEKKHYEELENLNNRKYELTKEIQDLSFQKQEITRSTEDKNKRLRDNFLEEYKDRLYVYAEELNEEQKKYLREEGFERTYQWDIIEKKTVEMFIKRRSNESESHAYLVGAVYNYIKEEIDPDVKMYETKMPDIVFFVNGYEWAIEVETGSLFRKNSRELHEKVKNLNKKFKDGWFFVVTNKELIPKYRKLGETVDRKNVIDKLLSIAYPEGISESEDM